MNARLHVAAFFEPGRLFATRFIWRDNLAAEIEIQSRSHPRKLLR